MGRIASPDHSKHNPCTKEQDQTYKCLADNNYDHDKCILAMKNYQLCKNFWGFVRMKRLREGKFPLLPEESDREKIKEEYLASFAKANKQ